MKVVGGFLLIVLLKFGFVATSPDQCTISDILSLESFCRSAVSTDLTKPQITCTTISAKGAYATCPSDHIPTSCSCGMACGSWDVQNELMCHCQCNNIDWTAARCCRINAR
ncbi:resistin-like [Microcaecilia unicolor]|uniref:Resistin-like n=1 Tax=Microcaecilia unicolor TaxID=1415580 RepID=A0A6P7ZBH5_9AMPH|nr:resistin-like [Microcaecilia unicolor]XP_030073019.1 resistin-like [Microcaecilia unicolor]